MKGPKIAIVGSGAVGTSFLYAAMTRALGSEYMIIDINEKAKVGNVFDLQDASSSCPNFGKVVAGEYSQLKDYDFIFISAGRPQKQGGETRLQLLEGNVEIMKSIAKEIKKSGFNGVTLIASNPVDIMSYTYLKVTGFEPNKVIGSGTLLNSARLRYAIATKYQMSSKDVQAYVIGEHGDSSVSIISSAKIAGLSLKHFSKASDIEKEFGEIDQFIRRRAYEIIERKGATFYGIGEASADVAEQILKDTKEVRVVAPLLTGQYGAKDMMFGTPCVLSRKGIEKILEIELSNTEKVALENSIKVLKDNIKLAKL
ncbi:L-lactate dehydrogenase [Mycoplasmoides genitalium]